MSDITRSQLKPRVLPIGEYELEITSAENIEGSTAGKDWQQLKVVTEIVSPSEFEGKTFTFRLFYNKQFADLIEQGLGKSLDEVFGKEDKISPENVIKLIVGQFFKCRIGIKNEFNEVVEFLDRDKKEDKIEI